MEASGVLPPNQSSNPPLHPVAAPATSAAGGGGGGGGAPAPELPKGRKRELEDGGFYDTSYFKIRSIIRDLRPFFIEAVRWKGLFPGIQEFASLDGRDMADFDAKVLIWQLLDGLKVLAAPDVVKSNVAYEINKRMKIMVELLKQSRNDTVFTRKSADPLVAHPFSHTTMEEFCRGLQGVKLAQQFQPGNVTDASANFMKESYISGDLQQKVSQGPQSQTSDTVMNKASVSGDLQPKASLGHQSRTSDTVMNEASACDGTPRKSVKRKQKVPKTAKFQQKVPQSGQVAGGSGEVKIPGLKQPGKQMEGNFQGTWIVGGSPFGWNFVVYPGDKPIYYGVTKASMLARRYSAK